MKKQIFTLALGLITAISYGQKKEIRTAEKAVKKADFAEAVSAINAAEPLIANADDKLKANFYFVKGQAYQGTKDLKTAAKAFNNLLELEKKTGKKKYSDEAEPILRKMVKNVSDKATSQYELKDFKGASENFYLSYMLSPRDTTYLFNAAITSNLAKDYDTTLKYYKELLDVGYTGITKKYLAVNKETGETEDLGTKQQRDLYVRTGTYITPSDKMTDSKRSDIISNMANVLSNQGKNEEAVNMIKEARRLNPESLDLLLTEAKFYASLNRMDEFGALMKKAIEKDPNNPLLFFNLGTVTLNEGKAEESKQYFKRAIELDPNYSDAYLNLAIAILEKDKAIVLEMNKSLSDFKKYEALEKQQKEVYKEALPILEKGDSLKRSLETVRVLLNIYEILEMEPKAKEFRELYKNMRG